MQINNITFINPEFFWLILIIPIILYFFYKKEKSGINISSLDEIKKIFKKNNITFYLKIILLGLILLNFIIILANPNTTNISEKIKKNGIDIVIALDVSGSMEANDLKPNRIESAKSVINNFISKLKTDRVGLVIFAGKPFTSIPLTFDYNILTETINNISTKNINQQKRGLAGTAIGDAILMSETLFISKENKQEREKVIILLTDGDANIGVDPKVAGLSSKEKNIKIYTVGIGSKQGGYITYNSGPFIQKQKISPLNDKDLKYIASQTKGVYFRAEDNKTFKKVFEELQKLQKQNIEVEIKKTYSEYYKIFIYSLIIIISIFFYLISGNIEKRKNK
ncbi:MAG: VWA domain-containing protein [Candidatus Gracilibacteria bacterium]|nr:VWA domain-containing protein [Candidatus Gracilibacteria bacterium]